MYTSPNPQNAGPPTQFFPSFLTTNTPGMGVPGVGSTVANQAYYIPLIPTKNASISAVTINCGTAAGNVDIGIYSYGGTRLSSLGATAAVSGNMTWTLSPRLGVSGGVPYWIAISASSASATFLRFVGTTAVTYLAGLQIQTTAHPLPSTATFATGGTAAFIPAFAVDFV